MIGREIKRQSPTSWDMHSVWWPKEIKSVIASPSLEAKYPICRAAVKDFDSVHSSAQGNEQSSGNERTARSTVGV